MFSRKRFFGLVAFLFFLAFSSLLSQEKLPIETRDLDQFNWRHIGPWSFSGRITNVAVPRGQTLIYYVLTASGGLWKTVDNGYHFEPIFEKYGNMSLGYLAIAPSDPNILYLGTGEPLHARSAAHGNGVWKSTDGGKTWTHLGLSQSYFIPKIEVDFRNPDIVYVACEGKLYDNEMDCERGLYKSLDGGKTWLNVSPVNDRGIADFIIDPRNSDLIIAAAYKTYRRTWTYIDRQPGNHLYKSTDGGKTWKKLTNGLPLHLDLGRNGLAIFEKNPNIVYARLDEEVNLGYDQRENTANFRQGQLFRDDFYFNKFKTYKIHPEIVKLVKFTPLQAEDEADLVRKLNDLIRDKDFLTKIGAELTKLHQVAKKVYSKNKELMEAISEVEKMLKEPETENTKGRYQVLNRHILEILYADAFRNLSPIKRSGVIYRSTDQGESWQRMTEYKIVGGSVEINQSEAGYYGRIYVDQTNENRLYCCDVNVTISEDGGKTFRVSGWDGNFKTHVDHRALWIDPQNPNHILSCNDGGLSETWDGGKHWHQKETISAQQFYDVAVDNCQPYNVMGGTQDCGCWIGPSRNRNPNGVYPSDWLYLPTGDGFYVVRDFWNNEFLYYESQFGNSSRINLKTGETIRLARRNTLEETAAGAAPQRYQWNAPIVISPHNPGIIYICSQYVHRSLTRGEPGTWQTISPDLSKNEKDKIELSKKTNLQYATIYTFAESPKKPGLFWAGTDDGNLQMSPDGGATWINITSRFYDKKGQPKKGIKGPRIPYDRWVIRVLPSAFDEKICYVAYSGYRTHNEDKTYLYITRDLGQTFEDISGGLECPVNDIEEDPHNPNILYLATDYGVFITFDQGKNWLKFSSKAPDVIIMDLAIQKRDRDLVIGTYGRGIYIADIFPLKEFKQENLEKNIFLFEPQEVIKWNMFDRRGGTYGEAARAQNPPVGATIYYYLKNKVNKVSVVIKDIDGKIIQELNGSPDQGIQKVFWNLSIRAAQPVPERGTYTGPAGRGTTAEPGIYFISLIVNGQQVETKKLIISPDPLDRPII
ncbi:MAG: hypothetical protein N3B16_10315 [Candidatus Aminicenantes bacterium]|nr:hypothetical protein [Candidatus Aminicenantes bacterium]